jgi:hypothetical protein
VEDRLRARLTDSPNRAANKTSERPVSRVVGWLGARSEDEFARGRFDDSLALCATENRELSRSSSSQRLTGDESFQHRERPARLVHGHLVAGSFHGGEREASVRRRRRELRHVPECK